MPKKIRPIRVDGNVAYVTLTKGLEAIIDASDVPKIGKFNWCARTASNTMYVARGGWDPDTKTTKQVSLHRQLMRAPDNMDVDHINGNGLDNRMSNLRLATKSQNRFNQRPLITNTTGFRGVTKDNKRVMWRAKIGLDGKTINLGRFDNPEDAYAAYCEANAKFHGEFGRVD